MEFERKEPSSDYQRELKEQLYSFAEALATAIERRSPYNADHTKRVSEYTMQLVDFLNRKHQEGNYPLYFDQETQDQLKLAAFLHDIGKITTPIAVMDKPSRLGSRMEKIRERVKLLKAYWEIDYLKGRCDKEIYNREIRFLEDLTHHVKEIDLKDYLEQEDFAYVEATQNKYYVTEQGKKIYYLTKYEVECLQIRSGTLTANERSLMEQHVVMTERILEKVKFSGTYSNVYKWAIAHHEFLDGTGYPHHLTGEDLPTEARILAIVDIYDALTATDRPYKQAMTVEEAFTTLTEMAVQGKLDRELVELWKEAVQSGD